MDSYSLNALISCAGVFVIAIIPLIQDRRNKLYISLFALNFAAAIWQLDLFLLKTVASVEAANLTSRILRFSMLLTPYLLFNFILTLTKFKKTREFRMISSGLLVSVLITVLMSLLGVGFNGMVYKINYGYVAKLDLIYVIFILNTAVATISSFYITIKKYNSKDITVIERKQLEYLTLGIFIAIITGFITLLNIAGLNVYLLGPYGMALYFILITYAILSFDLLNIREMLQKTIMYIVTAGMVMSIYLIIYYQIIERIPSQMYKITVLMLSSLFIVLAINPTLRLMDNLTKKAFFISHYDYQVLLQYVLNRLIFIKDIERLFSAASENIALMLKVKPVIAFFWDADIKCYVLYGDKKDTSVCVDEKHPLIKYIKLKKSMIYYKRILDDIAYYIDRKNEYKEIDTERMAEFLRNYSAEICLPITIGQEIRGFWLIGEKISKDILRAEEINWAKNVISQVSVIAENIFLYGQLMNSERLVMLGEMAAAVAHEIRNPLTGLSSFIQMMIEKNGQKEKIMNKFLKIAPPEFVRLERLTDNLLALSHTTRLNLITVNLMGLMEEIQEFLSHVLKKNKVELEINIDKKTYINADREQLRQVVLNLIMNAIQAMPGGGAVKFHAGLKTKENMNFVFIRVSDNGQGIDPEIRGKIFEPFFTTRAEGTGLGLAICRNIMQAHKGNIEVEPGESGGSAFYLYFPVVGG